MSVTRAALLCRLVLLVNLTTVVAVGYGDPDDFFLRRNANGGHYRAGHALSWETRSRIVALWIAGHSFTAISRHVRCGQKDRPGVHDFRSSGAPRADRRSEQTPQASHLGAAVHKGALARHFLHAPNAVSPTFLTLMTSASRFARSPSSKRGLTSCAPRLPRDCASISTSS